MHQRAHDPGNLDRHMLKSTENSALDQIRVPRQQAEANVRPHGQAGETDWCRAEAGDQFGDLIARHIEIRDRTPLD